MLAGDLADFHLADVLRLLAATGKTGTLELVASSASGRIDVVDGRIRDATSDRSRAGFARRLVAAELVDADTLLAAVAGLGSVPTPLATARALADADALGVEPLTEQLREHVTDAVFELARRHDGTFEVVTSTTSERGPTRVDLAIAVEEVLDEVQRRLDVWDELSVRTGSDHAVPSIARPSSGHAEVALSGDAWALLALVDGRRSVADLVELTGRGAFRTRRTLGLLLDAQLVAIDDAGRGRIERLARDLEALAAREAVTQAQEVVALPQVAVGGSTAPLALVPSAEPTVARAPAAVPTVVPAAVPAAERPTVTVRPAATAALTGRPRPVVAAVERTDPPVERADAPLVVTAPEHGPEAPSAPVTPPGVDDDLLTRLIAGVRAR